MTRLRQLAAVGTLAPFICWAAAADPPSDKLPPPTFNVHSIEGADATGPLLRLKNDWSVGLGLKEFPGANLITVRRVGAALPAYPSGPQVVFANGDRVSLDPGGPLYLAGDQLHFRPSLPLLAGEQTLRPPVNLVALVWLRPPQGTEDSGLLLGRLLVQQRNLDLVLLANGDFLEGVVIAIDVQKKLCRVKSARQVREVPLANLAALAFSSKWRTAGLPPGPYAQLVLMNGTRLSVLSATLDSATKTIQCKTLFGAKVQFPSGTLAALEMRQAKAVYLSDLEPSKYEHTPFLGVGWPYVKDGSVAGQELRLSTGTYNKGLGLHARSRLSYKIEGKYRFFEALVGLDARTGKAGRAAIQVLLDGKAQVLDKQELTGRTAPLALRLNVRGAKTLTLIVDFGSAGDVQSHVNWADARLIP